MVHAPNSIVSPPAAPRAVAALALALGLAGSPGGAASQVATVLAEENFRAEPNGTVLAVLGPATELRVFDQRPGWVQVELEGWVWIRSLQATSRDGFTLVVVPEDPGQDGENLRARAAGPVLARFVRGALLSEVERMPGWVRVVRRGWVWAASLTIDQDARPADSPVPGPATSPPMSAELLRAGPGGASILGTPDGDTLARATPGAEFTVLSRDGDWARVRVEGWVRVPDSLPPLEPLDPAHVTPAQVASDPATWRGRIVTWDLRFVSLERAETIRTDFRPGEPFILARPGSGSDALFVYVALPDEWVGEAERLTPLERIRVVGRIRVGSSVLTGSPILDLIELHRQLNPWDPDDRMEHSKREGVGSNARMRPSHALFHLR